MLVGEVLVVDGVVEQDSAVTGIVCYRRIV